MGIEFLLMVLSFSIAGGAAGARWATRRAITDRIPACECGHPQFEHAERKGGCRANKGHCHCDTFAFLPPRPELPGAVAGELVSHLD
jgi:hypothetical protein